MLYFISMKNKTEKTLKENVIFKGKVLTLNCDDIQCPNGVKATREVVHHHGGVCVLCELDNKIAFVKQFRYAYKEEILELPAGKLELNEDPYEAGIRELEEEIGYKAESLEDYGVLYPSVGYSDERLHMYVAKNPVKTSTNFDIDEDLDLIWLTKEEALEKIKTNEIKDGKTISLLMKYIYKK